MRETSLQGVQVLATKPVPCNSQNFTTPDSKSKRASSTSASLAPAPPSLEAVADLALCPLPRLVLLRPLEELLDRALELDLDLDGDLLWDLDLDTDLTLLLSLEAEHDLDPERELNLPSSPSSASAIVNQTDISEKKSE